ncbi:MAG: hypothetical protein ACOX3O_08855 [bacterium]
MARTATFALTNATLPYACTDCQQGLEAGGQAITRPWPRGVNIAAGAVTHQAVARALDYPYQPLEEVL